MNAVRPDGRFARTASLLGWLLVSVWSIWWADNLIQGRMMFAEQTWIRLPAFGVDFLGHVDRPTRVWLDHGDPYQDQQRRFSYPPIVTRLFVWVSATDPDTSLRIWICIAAIFAAFGAAAAVASRSELGLEPIPTSVGIAAILFSTSVLFALERANYDLLIVPCVAASVWLIRGNDASADVIAGLLLAIAAWAKVYPGLLILGLLALGHWRAATWMAVWGVLIGWSDLPELSRFIANVSADVEAARALARVVHEIHPWNHPLALAWRDLWAGTPLTLLPGSLGAAVVLGSLMTWVSWRVYRSADSRLSLAYLYWVAALATFVPAVSNDYNLTPLPLAVLALWTRKMPWHVHAALLALALWWQPIALPLSGRAVLFFKLAGLIAVALMLVRHAGDVRAAGPVATPRRVPEGG